MVKYTEPIMRKKFSGETLKEAKVKALQWTAKVMCKDELGGISFDIKEEDNSKLPTVALTLYVSILDSEARERHCQICKEFHSLFFINENCNCSECKAIGLQNRMHEMLQPKKAFYRAKLKSVLDAVSQTEKGNEDEEND